MRVKYTAAITGLLAAATLSGTVAFAHANPPTAAPETTDQIGVVAVSEKGADGNPVTNAVVQVERIPTSATTPDSGTSAPSSPPAASEAPTETAAPDSSTAAPTPPESTTGADQKLAFGEGSKILLITANDPSVIAVPAGTYRLTSLGVIADEDAPRPAPTDITVAAGEKTDAVLSADEAPPADTPASTPSAETTQGAPS